MEYVIIAFIALGGLTWWKGLHRVPPGRVGIVTKTLGMARKPGDDARVSFLGSRGVQAEVLRPNTTAWLPPFLYEVRVVPMVTVPNGTVGVVIAKAGRNRELGSAVAKYVDCDSFQDGARFLREEGVMGRQQQPLTGGSYAINTELFDVLTVHSPEEDLAAEELTVNALREVQIDIGETGVVVTRVGAKPVPNEVGPPVEGHADFQRPWAFLAGGGRIGVQQDTLAEAGRYAINPWFAKVVKVPTRVLVLEWHGGDKSDSNLDASLDQVELEVQGHKVWLDMKQTVEIPAQAAPRLVQRYGADGEDGRESVQRFVEKHLAGTVTGYFRRISAHYRIQQFITEYDALCNELAAEVRQALAPIGVKGLATTLEEFRCDDEEINRIRRKIAHQQELAKLEHEKLAELEATLANEEVRTLIDLQQVKVEEARKKLELIKLTTMVELLGAQNVALERMLREWVKANVPQFVGGGDSGMAQALLQAMPFSQAKDMLLAMAGGAQRTLPEPAERAAIEGEDPEDPEDPHLTAEDDTEL
ncbi:SPFH domain-containing protein [Saccharothrix australiensis]|uniref:Putative membrane protein YqiK n=1 Tax=Saccharothrix australiensis TaxID=2072 RepID=A0A495VVS3_9PSEU|nr:SPFH domain-containing protein [Saccharothrix australiensis]RKT51738.1 putative membrane protein YqiK [Saccharothrix australiensis]